MLQAKSLWAWMPHPWRLWPSRQQLTQVRSEQCMDIDHGHWSQQGYQEPATCCSELVSAASYVQQAARDHAGASLPAPPAATWLRPATKPRYKPSIGGSSPVAWLCALYVRREGSDCEGRTKSRLCPCIVLSIQSILKRCSHAEIPHVHTWPHSSCYLVCRQAAPQPPAALNNDPDTPPALQSPHGSRAPPASPFQALAHQAFKPPAAQHTSPFEHAATTLPAQASGASQTSTEETESAEAAAAWTQSLPEGGHCLCSPACDIHPVRSYESEAAALNLSAVVRPSKRKMSSDSQSDHQSGLSKNAPSVGLEPTTIRLRVVCSTN